MLALGQTSFGTGRCNRCVDHFGVTQRIDNFLSNQNFATDGAVLALGQASCGTGSFNCCIDHFGVAQSANDSLGNQNFATNGAMLAFCQAGLGTGGIDCLINNFLVTQRIDNFLLHQNFVTDGAVLTFRQTSFGTGGIDCLINNFLVTQRIDNFLLHQNFVTDGAMFALSLTGCATGGCNCFIDHFGMAQCANSHGLAADLVTTLGTISNRVVRTSLCAGCILFVLGYRIACGATANSFATAIFAQVIAVAGSIIALSVGCVILCSVGRVSCHSCDCRIPTDESVLVVPGCFFIGASLKNWSCTVFISFFGFLTVNDPSNHVAVLGRRVGRRIGCLATYGYHGGSPAGEGISILCSCCLSGSCTRVGRSLTVSNLGALQYVSIFVNELDGVLVHGLGVGCGVGYFTCNCSNFLIPTAESVGILGSCCLGGSVAGIDGHFTIFQHIRLQFGAISIYKLDSVASQGAAELCGIGGISSNRGERLVPAGKSVGVLSRCGLCGSSTLIAGSCSVSHLIGLQCVAITVVPSDDELRTVLDGNCSYVGNIVVILSGEAELVATCHKVGNLRSGDRLPGLAIVFAPLHCVRQAGNGAIGLAVDGFSIHGDNRGSLICIHDSELSGDFLETVVAVLLIGNSNGSLTGIGVIAVINGILINLNDGFTVFQCDGGSLLRAVIGVLNLGEGDTRCYGFRCDGKGSGHNICRSFVALALGDRNFISIGSDVNDFRSRNFIAGGIEVLNRNLTHAVKAVCNRYGHILRRATVDKVGIGHGEVFSRRITLFFPLRIERNVLRYCGSELKFGFQRFVGIPANEIAVSLGGCIGFGCIATLFNLLRLD